jgi:DNA mismatch repair ATPase MutS
VLTDPEFFALKQSIFFLRQVTLEGDKVGLSFPDVPEHALAELAALLDPEKSGSPAFYLADGYSAELAAVRAMLRDVQRRLIAEKQRAEEEATAAFGVTTNPAGEVVVSRLNETLRDALDDSGRFSLSRETYTDAYYSINPYAAESKLQHSLSILRDQESHAEDEVRLTLSRRVRAHADALYKAFAAVATFDLTLARARLALEWNAVRPSILPDTEQPVLIFKDARHPKVEEELQSEDRDFTPISLVLARGLSVITGANMGGKTVALRTIGLLAALTAYGCFLPVKEARLGLFSNIAILAGDYSADHHDGLSRFGQEVVGLREMLKLRDKRSLLLIDELAASTNPFEGSALAVAVAEYLNHQTCIAVLTTHYDLVHRLEDVPHWQVVGLSRVPGEELRLALDPGEQGITVASLMDYTLRPVDARKDPPREAIRVARHLKLPAEIIRRALDLTTIEPGGDKYE